MLVTPQVWKKFALHQSALTLVVTFYLKGQCHSVVDLPFSIHPSREGEFLQVEALGFEACWPGWPAGSPDAADEFIQDAAPLLTDPKRPLWVSLDLPTSPGAEGGSCPLCARSPQIKHSPGGWSSSFLYPNLILHLLFRHFK